MNIRVRRDITGFYIAKQLQGKTFSNDEIRHIFKVRHPFAPGPIKYFKYVQNSNQKFIVMKCHLVQRKYVLRFFNEYGPGDLWRLNHRHITGTNLYLYYDEDDVAFWRLPKYGRTSRYLPEDIEARHIGKHIKDRPQIMLLLKMIKQQNLRPPIQLKLFE